MLIKVVEHISINLRRLSCALSPPNTPPRPPGSTLINTIIQSNNLQSLRRQMEHTVKLPPLTSPPLPVSWGAGGSGYSDSMNISLSLGCRGSCTLVLTPRLDRCKMGKSLCEALAFTCRHCVCVVVVGGGFVGDSSRCILPSSH